MTFDVCIVVAALAGKIEAVGLMLEGFTATEVEAEAVSKRKKKSQKKKKNTRIIKAKKKGLTASNPGRS